MNWLTAVFVVVFLWSVYRGIQRRFARQAASLVWQCVSLAAVVAAALCAWFVSNRLSAYIVHLHPDRFPLWAVRVVQAWQQSPSIAHLVVFLGFYTIVSTFLHGILRPLPPVIARAIPNSLGTSRVLGGAVGVGVGVVRTIILGAAVFLVLEVVSVPSLSAAARTSAPYQALSTSVFSPWLKPLVTKELPVLANGAFEPLAKNINLFAVPTGTQGTQTGVLVVPNEIAARAHAIADGKSSDREKAYALYEWEIHHVSYDWNKYNDYVYHHKWDAQSPLDTLHTGKGVCADYALLYADMAHAVGLTVEVDEGIGGTPTEYGPHAWNRVWDATAKQWLPVDTTWGSEQDAWFNPAHFGDTHQTQTTIRVEGTH